MSHDLDPPEAAPRPVLPRRSRSPWLLLTACLLLVAVWHRTPPFKPPPEAGPAEAARSNSVRHVTPKGRLDLNATRARSAQGLSAEEIVTNKVNRFARSRRELVRALARRSGLAVPPEVEQFFDAIEAGRWEDIDARFNAMSKRSGQYEGSSHEPALDTFWSAVLDAYGVAEQAHLWPAQKLLDYGEAILGSLRPGMVYVGGTDNGRWIPELLNETSEDAPHVIITQNALADNRYRDFIKELYGDQVNTLTDEESQGAFQDYIADAQKRLDHDQHLPEEPKQLRPGEDVRSVDGRIQVSGQTAVMAINEKLLETFMAKNPGLSFALQESFPLRGTYADALPLGPLMELHAPAASSSFTPERAAQSLDYWQRTADQILSDPEATGSQATLKSYSKDAGAAANLLAAHDYTGAAEQAYRLAQQFCPDNPESVGGLAALLARTGRADEARQVIDDFTRRYPDQAKSLQSSGGAWSLTGPAQPGKP